MLLVRWIPACAGMTRPLSITRLILYQGRGIGKRAIKVFIDFVREQHSTCKAIRLTVHADNQVARRLYRDVEFGGTGEEAFGEQVYCLEL